MFERSRFEQELEHLFLFPIHLPIGTRAVSTPNKIGFEFDIYYNLTSIKPGSNDYSDHNLITIPDDELVTNHTWSTDGFKVKMDGNKLEINTKPFELSDAGKAEMANTFANIRIFTGALKANLSDRSKGVRFKNRYESGKYFILSDKALQFKDKFYATEHYVFPLNIAQRKKGGYYSESPDLYGNPQSNIGIPLSKVNDLAALILNSQGASKGKALTGRSGQREGLKSTALQKARHYVVNVARKYFIGKTVNGLSITEANFSQNLEGFLILLVQYFWSGEVVSSSDYESHPKAYIPLVCKARFRDMFHRILNAGERAVFNKVFWEGTQKNNLYSLVKLKDVSQGDAKLLFPTKTQDFMVGFSGPISWKKLIDSIMADSKDLEPNPGAPTRIPGEKRTLVTPLADAIPPNGDGIVLELRRIAHFSHREPLWEPLANYLFDTARKMNSSR